MSLKAVTQSLFKRLFVPNVKASDALIHPVPVKEYELFSELKQILKPENNTIDQFNLFSLTSSDQRFALDLIKQYYLPEHVIVREKGIDLKEDKALDEYLYTLLRQGNTIFAKTTDGSVAGFCVNCVCTPDDPINIKEYAYFRQDPCTKSFLNFAAKLHEVPNLWKAFQVEQYYDINMLAVLPKYRRQGLSVLLAEKAMRNAINMGCGLIRMNCINQYDYKIAERCMMHCISKFPLNALYDKNEPFIKKSSENNRKLRVYVTATGAPKDLVTLYRYNRILDDIN